MIIGIDLGTTNSLVSFFGENGPIIIPNKFGENLTPSVIYIPRSFRFDASACLFDTSGEDGLHWLV